MKPDLAPLQESRAGLTFYATACAIGTGAVLLSNWPGYSYAILGWPPPILYFAAACLVSIPIVVVDPAAAMRLLTAPIFWWFVAYVALGLIWLLGAQDFIDSASQLWRLRLIQYFLLCAVMLLCLHAQKHSVAFVVLGIALLASVFNWMDLMRPFRFVPQGIEGANPGRGAGLFINANSAAEFLTVATVVSLPFVAMRYRALVLAGMMVGVAPTLSRGGLLIAVMVVAGAVVTGLLNRLQSMMILIGIPALALAAVLSYDRLVEVSDSPIDVTVSRLWEFEGQADGYSADARRWAARKTGDMIFEQPILGHGVGATTRESVSDGPHNMYLLLAAEQGLFGLALYLTLIGSLVGSGWRLIRLGHTVEARDIGRALVIYASFFLVGGLFSHNVLEAPYLIFTLGFLVAAASGSAYGESVAVRGVTSHVLERSRWRSSIPLVGTDYLAVRQGAGRERERG